MLLKRLAIIGVGLIGGSLALALKRAQVVSEVVGCGRTASELEKAVRLGVLDRYSTDPEQAVRGAELIVVATPVGAMRAIFEAIRPAVDNGAVITDAGSVKASVLADARAALGEAYPRFVGAHPIAGTEQSGVDACFADLYVDHRVILTPAEQTLPSAAAKVHIMWARTGAQVEVMDAGTHDQILAYTSHLPHMVAYSLVDCLGRAEPAEALRRFAAGGFRDITRIASSHPIMWRDIALANRDALLESLRSFSGGLEQIVHAVESGDGERLADLFSRARETRDRLAPGANAHADE